MCSAKYYWSQSETWLRKYSEELLPRLHLHISDTLHSNLGVVMSYKDWYTVNSKPDGSGFVVVAVDKDLEFQKQYEVSTASGNCECVAGHTWCRHKKMVKIFEKANRINSRRYYNFDREKWMPEVKNEL